MPSLLRGRFFKGNKMTTKNPYKQNKTKTWQDRRIHKINKSGGAYSPDNKYFKEVYAIYESKAKSYKEFKKDFISNGGVICTK